MFRSLRLALSLFVLAAITLGTVSVTLAGGPKVLDARLTGIPTGGLVLVSNGTNPIQTGRAILTCSGVAVARSGDVPFSAAGDATVEANLNLPDICLAPAVFFVGLTSTGAERWLAVTGT